MSAISNPTPALEAPKLERARHIKYWTRCLKTFLPHQYTSNDSNRMYLAFFIISSLDLLDALTTVSTEEERKDYINWIYGCQHPKGGFRMWPGTDFGDISNETNAHWDPANIPATYFALSSLLILGDDLKRIRRLETLNWIQKMQRADGSFGETFVHGKVEGGMDPRFGYCALGIRYILRGPREGRLLVGKEEMGDIDFDNFVKCVQDSESYDGGIADQPFHEPHAGYTYCSLGALAFIERLSPGTEVKSKSRDPVTAPRNREGVLKWLASRQTDLMDPDSALDSEFVANTTSEQEVEIPTSNNPPSSQTEPIHQSPDKSTLSVFPGPAIDCAGMCGRENKVADTCYAFWVGASLHILGQPLLCDRSALIRYLLEETQHPVLGGFGKFPGDLPDLYHSYLGLAALSLAGGEGVKALDAGMCLSKDAQLRLPALWKAWDVQVR